MKKEHWLLMMVGCAAPVVALVALPSRGLGAGSSLLLLVLLVCPLMHVLMMRGHSEH